MKKTIDRFERKAIASKLSVSKAPPSLVCFIVVILFAAIGCITLTTAEPQTQRMRRLSANTFPGVDLGAKINAADRALGANGGEITVSGGGIISTQIIVSSGHVLHFLPGTYAFRTADTPILMKSNSSVVGSGWDSILVESTAPGQFVVICAYNQQFLNGSPDAGLVIRDLQVKGANPGFHSAPPAIYLGNCSDCLIDKVWVNGTRSIGIAVGGSGSGGHFAQNSKVTNCRFTRVASQNLALVNGRNIVFEGNQFITSGQVGGPGNTNIDVEPNETGDRLQDVIIRNNLIDVRNSDTSPTGNGIVVQATTGTPYVGPITIENNTVIGGSNTGTITNVLSNGIYVFGTTMQDVMIRNNKITRTGQSGIRIEGTRISVLNNQLTDVGGGGTPGFVVQATDSRIIGNTLSYSGNGPADSRMVVLPGSRGNVIQNNRGWEITGAVR